MSSLPLLLPAMPQLPERPQTPAAKAPHRTANKATRPTTRPTNKPTHRAHATKGGREMSDRIVHVSGLTKAVDDATLTAAFLAYGTVVSTKIRFDKNRHGLNYAFVEMAHPDEAEGALRGLNKTLLDNSPIQTNWAYQLLQASPLDTVNLFVGDLLLDVDDAVLLKAFSHFSSIQEAHVIWDMNLGRLRGYGFVLFASPAEAEQALVQMHGQQLKSRPMRVSRAHAKQPKIKLPMLYAHMAVPFQQPVLGTLPQQLPVAPHPYDPHGRFMPLRVVAGGVPSSVVAAAIAAAPSTTPIPGTAAAPESYYSALQAALPFPAVVPSPPGHSAALAAAAQAFSPSVVQVPYVTPVVSSAGRLYDEVMRLAPQWQSTVYLGNLSPTTTQNDLFPLLLLFGYIITFSLLPDRGCAFVKYDTHDRAAFAIVLLSGFNVNGRPLRCDWGRERPGRNAGYA